MWSGFQAKKFNTRRELELDYAQNQAEPENQAGLVSYNITDDEEMLRQSTNGFTGVKVNFVLSRRLLNQILTTFLPTIAIVIVSFSTNYYRVW